jgi:hypothetical protein
MGRKKETEHSSMFTFLGSRPNLQTALMPHNNSKRNPEPKTSSVDPFRGVERLEYVLNRFWSHSVTSISYGDPNSGGPGTPKPGFASPNSQEPASTHRVNGIADQIMQDLADISFVADNGTGAKMLQIKIYIRISQPTPIHAQRWLQKFFSRDSPRSRSLPMES